MTTHPYDIRTSKGVIHSSHRGSAADCPVESCRPTVPTPDVNLTDEVAEDPEAESQFWREHYWAADDEAEANQ